LDCKEPKVSCTPSKWETETTNGLIAGIANMIPNVPESLRTRVIELCKVKDCSGMGPAQLAWCARNIDQCALAQDAAAQARDASTDLIKGTGDEDIAKRNAIRHALWIALMISAYGISERDALLLGTAHEMDDRSVEGRWGSSDSKIDLHNNFIGAEVGRAVLQWKVSNPSRSAYNQTVHLVYLLADSSNNCSACLNLLGGTKA
jgi:hypothetical protein